MHNKPKPKFTCAICSDNLIVQYDGNPEYCRINPDTGRVGPLEENSGAGPSIICLTNKDHDCTRRLTAAEINKIIEAADRRT
jgi:hypothetical protein